MSSGYSQRKALLSAALLFILIGLLFAEASGLDLGMLKGLKKPNWAIGIYAGTSPFHLKPAAGARNPVISASDVTDLHARYVADPFMVHEGRIWYMFIEVDNARTNQGDIGFATSDDGLNWKYRGIVLDEPFHLSYPQVFKWNGEYYMIPESKQAHSVRLYRALRFPSGWKLEAILLRIPGVDPTILRWHDRWWLFVCGKFTRSFSLRLFYSDTLTGPWVEHPKSPIIEADPTKSRAAGRMIIIDGYPVRFAQDDQSEYGKQVRAFRITRLTPEEYAEEELPESPILKGTGTGWNAAGMHHVDAHRLPGGGWIAAVDGHSRFSLIQTRSSRKTIRVSVRDR